MTLRNDVLAVLDQPPREWLNGNAQGIFSRRSHTNAGGKPKIKYGSKANAAAAADSLQRRYSDSGVPTEFAAYKCMFCDGYHVGRNR